MFEKPEPCRWRNTRCYLPTVVLGILLGIAIGYLTFLLQGSELARIGRRQMVSAFLLWIVLSPVIIGLLRSCRRRHW